MNEQVGPDWVLVHEFGQSQCLVDKQSFQTRGDFVTADVMYVLRPPGTDKRNGKKITAMINSEEYDVRSGKFRVHRIVFKYADGTESALVTPPEWRAATGGNSQTLMFLRSLPK